VLTDTALEVREPLAFKLFLLRFAPNGEETAGMRAAEIVVLCPGGLIVTAVTIALAMPYLWLRYFVLT
jgi:hypothetical protein